MRLRSLFGNDFHPMVPDSLKGFQLDFREQSELVHSHFVLPLCTALSPLRARLSETRKGNFARKTNTLIRVNSQAVGSHRLFLPSLFAVRRESRCALKKCTRFRKCKSYIDIFIPVRSLLFRRSQKALHELHRDVKTIFVVSRIGESTWQFRSREKTFSRINAKEQFLSAHYLRQLFDVLQT